VVIRHRHGRGGRAGCPCRAQGRRGGLDLTFLRTIPGAIGGAVRMNAGCYGTYVADVFRLPRRCARAGEVVTLTAATMNFSYRQPTCPRAGS
jgi:UDP-N-acetylmuramate dehydrogenase